VARGLRNEVDQAHPFNIMITSLEQLYLDQIRDLYSAENQLLAMLPQMAAHATTPELRSAFGDHLEETRKHCARLEIINDRHGMREEPGGGEVMQRLLIEAKRYLIETVPGEVRDAALIAVGNRVEHEEIAAYRAASALATSLGFGADADLLDETLKEERATDALISKIASGRILRSGMSETAFLL